MAHTDEGAKSVVSEPPQSAERLLTAVAAPERFDFDLAEVSRFQTPLVRKLRLDWWHLALLAFVLFFVVPGVSALLNGRAFPPLNRPWFGAHAGPQTEYYLTDLVHTVDAFSVTLFGSALSIVALVRYRSVVAELIERGLIAAPDAVLREESAAIRRWYGSRALRLLLFALSSYATYQLVLLTRDPNLKDWWGHTSHGWSGCLAAGVSWLVFFIGGLAVLRLALGLRALSRLFAYPVRLRPLHADGCNGFAVFGDYLVLLFFCAVAIAISVWVPLYCNYLGIERYVSLWLVGGLAMSAIPVFLIWPLASCTLRISRARSQRLESIETALHGALEKLENDVGAQGTKELSTALSEIAAARSAMTEIFPANIFPFKPKIAGLLSASYALQLAAFAQKAAEALRHL